MKDAQIAQQLRQVSKQLSVPAAPAVQHTQKLACALEAMIALRLLQRRLF